MALRPGNHDKAWNDPPVLAYQTDNAPPPTLDNAGSGGPTTKRTILNKRVAFPMTSSSSSTTTGTQPPVTKSLIMPPQDFGSPPPMGPPADAVPTEDLGTCQQTASADVPQQGEEADKLYVSMILDGTLETFQDKEKQAELRKRLQVLYASWSNKLNPDIQSRMKRLCQCIERNDITTAMSLQVSLAVDYSSECSSWILAIKNILTSLS